MPLGRQPVDEVVPYEAGAAHHEDLHATAAVAYAMDTVRERASNAA
jgi:hypothetical protein